MGLCEPRQPHHSPRFAGLGASEGGGGGLGSGHGASKGGSPKLWAAPTGGRAVPGGRQGAWELPCGLCAGALCFMTLPGLQVT